MASCLASKAQEVKLTAEFDSQKGEVQLNWNMVDNATKTGYVLLRSMDGKSWVEAAKDRIVRNYTAEDGYSFDDKFYTPGKNYYRIRIFDGYNNTVALSPIITINTKEQLLSSPAPSVPASKGSPGSWVLFPNPVSDVLTLSYKGSDNIPGVVNVQVIDMTGKVVIKFRSASINKTIQIPVSNLRTGTYIIQLSVMNEMLMNQKFMKQ